MPRSLSHVLSAAAGVHQLFLHKPLASADESADATADLKVKMLSPASTCTGTIRKYYEKLTDGGNVEPAE